MRNDHHNSDPDTFAGHRAIWQLVLASLLTAVALILMLFAANALVGQAAEVTPPAGISLYFTDNLTATTTSQTATAMESALLAAIANATTTIDVALYDFDRASIRDALIAAWNRGVAIRVVGDDDARVSDKSKSTFDALTSAGIPMVFDGSIEAAAMRVSPSGGDEVDPAAVAEMTTSRIMHDKYFIFDRSRVWAGSVNMSDTDLTLNHNHAMLIDNADVAAIYQSDFDQMYGGVFGNQKRETITTTATVGGMEMSIVFAPQDAPIESIVREIDAAQRSIDFAIFFFTHDDVRDALLRAHQRGVAIRGLWDNLGSKDGSSDDEALCQAGVAIKVENTRGIMHHKMMVIDGGAPDARVIAGSLNWTAGGTTYNNENTLILRNLAVAQLFTAAFDQMWTGIAVEPCNPVRQAGIISFFLPIIHNQSQPGIPVAPTATPRATATPVGPTPTATPAPGAVEIVAIVYDPPGADLESERVVIANRAALPVDMTGWTLRDDATNANVFTFPQFVLATGAEATIWVKSGTNSSTDLFWGRSQAVWNNDGDVAYLRTLSGFEIDACAYLGEFEQTDCQ